MLSNLSNSFSDSSSTTSSSSEEEDYINMEVDDHHHSCILNHQSSNNEFEFQQSFSSCSDRDATTSPADELFYMGKLLPLHLPPRLEMVNKILQSSASSFHAPKGENYDDEAFATPALTPTATTPFESCEVSRELNPAEYMASFEEEKKSWTKKMKTTTKQPSSSSSSSSKSKWTSYSYIKSLFTKSSGCTNKHSAAAAADHSQLPKENKNSKKSAPFGQIKYNKNCSSSVEEERGRHRRSFSEAIKQLSKPKSAPPISNNFNLVVFKRSISSTTEIESPIQAAIAHCKRSQNSRHIAIR